MGRAWTAARPHPGRSRTSRSATTGRRGFPGGMAGSGPRGMGHWCTRAVNTPTAPSSTGCGWRKESPSSWNSMTSYHIGGVSGAGPDGRSIVYRAEGAEVDQERPAPLAPLDQEGPGTERAGARADGAVQRRRRVAPRDMTPAEEATLCQRVERFGRGVKRSRPEAPQRGPLPQPARRAGRRQRTAQATAAGGEVRHRGRTSGRAAGRGDPLHGEPERQAALRPHGGRLDRDWRRGAATCRAAPSAGGQAHTGIREPNGRRGVGGLAMHAWSTADAC